MTEIAELMRSLVQGEGGTGTCIPGLSIHMTYRSAQRVPLLYEKGVFIVGQGAKRVHLGGAVYEYDPDHYLVISLPVPAECDVYASREKPLLALKLDIDMAVLNGVIAQMEDHLDLSGRKHDGDSYGYKGQSLFLAEVDAHFKDVVLRLLRSLESPLESRVLGPGLIRELLFRIMLGENASSLHALVLNNSNLSRIDNALRFIHGNFNQPVDVEALAGVVNMSTSAFYRAFKEATSFSPIQYLKKVRLNKARSLLAEEGVRAGEAARLVGYESASQFSREFKRYFGASPSKLVETYRG